MASEQKKIDKFKEFIVVNNLEPLPDAYIDPKDRLVYRFLQSRYWDFADTYDAIFDHKCWASHTLPID